ncbi:TPA: fimbrial protein [Salmonella enterica subsp. enterica serovar Reading]
MKYDVFYAGLYLFLSAQAFAGTETVATHFVITNKTIEEAKIIDGTTTASGARILNTGSDIYSVSDDFRSADLTELKDRNIIQNGFNQQPGLKRDTSLFQVEMEGQILHHKFKVKGKYANSSLRIEKQPSSGLIPYSLGDKVDTIGCSSVAPTDSREQLPPNIQFFIKASSDVNSDCTGGTRYITFPVSSGMKLVSTGESREVYLDLGALQRDKAYRDAPPDIYTGEGIYNGEKLRSHNVHHYTLGYRSVIEIIKNPYFENVSLPSGGDNIFSVRKVGNEIRGDLVIPYVINGHFTPYNKITLSLDPQKSNFKLKNTSDPAKEIPYSLSTGIGRQSEYSLVTEGSYTGPIYLTNLTNENHSLQGRFNASFSIDAASVSTGEYTDTLTAIFEIAL